MIALADLNALPRQAFVARLADIYEHSPWVPDGASIRRPFASRNALHAAMEEVVAKADEPHKLALLRAHPELAGNAALRGDLTAHSLSEQNGSGLIGAPTQTVERLQGLNKVYAEKFGFPFIIAVRGLDRDAILARLEERIGHRADVERAEALRQVGRIAALRLEALIED